ncbi:meiotic recombination protein dmc1 [Fusarium austroafricanum]|uniref:Meiotic recombination protein dmc1 n=1 Tax=Fusarium austroafricanum TaxID=2364996 RepID=A0A8H4KIZ7_9HYPO|nr:meiotic recombination protein dmc1 [Fusarium austroafricanum]
MDSPGPGGFLPEAGGGLPSPSPSSASSFSNVQGLPAPRSKALKPNSSKEFMVRRYAEEQLLLATRRYVKKFGQPEPGDTVVGYTRFGEVCRDLDGIVNILWKSGTPTLQIPFLLRLTSDFTRYVRSFPPAPKASFAILRKLDHCFASLLSGQDIETHETLPGFENGLRGGMTTTEMIRCRSLVDQCRVLMVEVMRDPAEDEEEDEEAETDTDTDAEGPGIRGWGSVEDDDEMMLQLDAARVFEKTIVQLNERLGDLEPLQMSAD